MNSTPLNMHERLSSSQAHNVQFSFSLKSKCTVCCISYRNANTFLSDGNITVKLIICTWTRMKNRLADERCIQIHIKSKTKKHLWALIENTTHSFYCKIKLIWRKQRLLSLSYQQPPTPILNISIISDVKLVLKLINCYYKVPLN